MDIFLAQPTLPTNVSLSSVRAATSKRCYRCGHLGHYAHSSCPHLTENQYVHHRYKFGRNGEIIEKVKQGQQQSKDDLYSGYGSDEEQKLAGASRPRGPPRGPPRGTPRGPAQGPPLCRGPGRPRPPMKMRKTSIVPKKVVTISKKALEAEAKMNKAFADAKEVEVDDATRNRWENAEKILVEYRTCPRTKRKVRVDLWDAHLSSLSAEILPYLYLGGERNAHNHKELTYRTQIGFVLNCAWEVSNFYPDELEYLKLPISDFKDQAGALAKDLNKAADFIDRARSYHSKVLVHCVAGISRSSSVCIHYLITREGWTFNKAYHHVLQLRPIIRPNIGFFRELQRVERECLGYNTMSVQDWHDLESGIQIASFTKIK